MARRRGQTAGLRSISRPLRDIWGNGLALDSGRCCARDHTAGADPKKTLGTIDSSAGGCPEGVVRDHAGTSEGRRLAARSEVHTAVRRRASSHEQNSMTWRALRFREPSDFYHCPACSKG
jgi:hypothetical protein